MGFCFGRNPNWLVKPVWVPGPFWRWHTGQDLPSPLHWLAIYIVSLHSIPSHPRQPGGPRQSRASARTHSSKPDIEEVRTGGGQWSRDRHPTTERSGNKRKHHAVQATQTRKTLLYVKGFDFPSKNTDYRESRLNYLLWVH